MIELFRTTTFRLALAYFALFLTSVLAVLALIYWETVVYANQQTDETIDAEITGLAEQYRQRGLTGLVEVVAERSDPSRTGGMLYLLTDSRQRPLAGNLARWPDVTVGPDGWMRFTLHPVEGQTGGQRVAQATSFILAGGYQLLVGRDLAERTQFDARLMRALAWSAALTLMLGLAGGLIMSRRILIRIEAINRASDRVMAGELGRRIPVRGNGDEFDRLALNLNGMLERIELLMQGIRQVSDNIAHDLRSPLGRLRSRLEMALRDEGQDQAQYHERIAEAINDADQLLATFSALLQIAEAEAGSERAEMSNIEFGELVRSLADLYEPVAEEAGLSFGSDVAAEPIAIRGNRHLLSRAIANLIENAVKYTPPPGSVTVSAAEDGADACLTVEDSGPGIAPGDRNRVFDRFVRLEQSRTSEGNGLGLSLVRAVIGLHGGRVSLEDNAPGLRAVIRLPLRPQAVSTAPTRVAPAAT